MGSNQANYLIDFYHLCDYLADASVNCAPQNPQSWFKQQKHRLKHNQVKTVLMSLKPHLEPENLRDTQAPVRVCYRYLVNRPGQFNYQDAISDDLYQVRIITYNKECIHTKFQINAKKNSFKQLFD